MRTASRDDARWLTPPEEDAWLAVALIMLQLPSRLDSEMQRECGLSLFDYLVLSTLSMAPQRTLRMSDLAREVNGSLTRLSNVARRLQDEGLLRRAPDPTDGRFTVARLTNAGWKVVVAAAPSHVDAVRRLVIDPLTAGQLRTLAATGRRLRPVLDA